MRKLAVISLLIIYLFNLTGYSVLFHFFIDKSDKQTIVQLDNANYNMADLVEMKVPLNMLYINNTQDYERTDGQIELNHIYYNYVMRKVQNDTLYLLCLPNYNKTQLCYSKANYSKLANDIPVNKKSSENNSKKGSNASDYDDAIVQFHFAKAIEQTTSYKTFTAINLSTSSFAALWQPPQTV